MNGLIKELVKVDVENITTLDELKNISEGAVLLKKISEDAVFFDRDELVIKNDRGENNLKYGFITTIRDGDFNGIKETSYFYIKRKPSKGLIESTVSNYPKGTDEFNKHFKRIEEAGLK